MLSLWHFLINFGLCLPQGPAYTAVPPVSIMSTASLTLEILGFKVLALPQCTAAV